MSGLIDLNGFSVKTTDATKKSVEARVSLLSRYSFRWRGGLKAREEMAVNYLNTAFREAKLE
ncbi:MAG: hypothetical protein SPE17_00860 [Alloprevotella sp.]|nr:hypothetical protein [Alloprevotella sp.]